ncbi:WYL domain-containing protein [Ruminococcaceae bacterium OttesenSCG-928-D13]|nr:WYL domain-containing protein [Ruminococcaceae bacterium OttesenSCG-928-D13]
MAKSANQKLKLLYLVEILQQETDEDHPMDVAGLISALDRRGIAAERKSIYDDMETLQQYGLDVVTVRGRSNTYYLGERDFQLPELKLLVDAVQSAKFITTRKSRELIKKICALASRHEAGLMQRQVHIQNQAKTFNEHTYYNVDAIQNALGKNRQIRFYYYEWTIDPTSSKRFARRRRHEGKPYQISPWSLLWDDEFYYLIAWDDEAGDGGMIKHYRVDKMSDIELLDDKRLGRQAFEALDISEYSKGVFGMFGGQETDVKLRVANRLIGVMVDRFGSDLYVSPSGSEYFCITVKAAVSPQFLSWLFGFGRDVQVLSPTALVQQVRREIDEIADLYNSAEK